MFWDVTHILSWNSPPYKLHSFCERDISLTNIQTANKDLTLKTLEMVNLSLVVHCLVQVPQPATEKYLHVREELIILFFSYTIFLGFQEAKCNPNQKQCCFHWQISITLHLWNKNLWKHSRCQQLLSTLQKNLQLSQYKFSPVHSFFLLLTHIFSLLYVKHDSESSYKDTKLIMLLLWDLYHAQTCDAS